MINFLNKNGESLIEVIITMFILSMSMVAISALINISIYTSNSNQNKIKAIYLAEEGKEAVRNIIATNWLRFPTDRERCWNVLDEKIKTAEDCLSNKIVDNQNYVLDWAHQNTTGLQVDRPYFKWELIPLDEDFSTEGVLNKEYCMYKVENISGRQGLLHQDPTLMSDCDFYRQINISYPDSSSPDDSSSMTVISKVAWMHKGIIRQVEAETNVFNNSY